MDKLKYWAESIRESCLVNHIELTDEQINILAEDIKTSFDNYNLHFHEQSTYSELKRQIDELKRKLNIEKNMKVCTECGGVGSIQSYGIRYTSRTCCTCNGNGKVL